MLAKPGRIVLSREKWKQAQRFLRPFKTAVSPENGPACFRIRRVGARLTYRDVSFSESWTSA